MEWLSCGGTAVQFDLWFCFFFSPLSAKSTDAQQRWQMPDHRPPGHPPMTYRCEGGGGGAEPKETNSIYSPEFRVTESLNLRQQGP